MRFSQLIGVTVCLLAATYADTYNDYDDSKQYAYYEDDEDLGDNFKFTYFIVGGKEVDPNSWPWISAVYRVTDDGFNFLCAATLVTTKHLISAAHCFPDFRSPSKYFVMLGRFNLLDWSKENKSEPRDITSITLHPQYIDSNKKDADLVILTLSREVNTTLLVAPISLVSSKQETLRTDGAIFGWGRSETAVLSREPLQVDLKAQSQQVCQDDHPNFKNIMTDNFFCAGISRGVDSCNGDSGGGFFFKRQNKDEKSYSWRLQGVISKTVTLYVDQELSLHKCTKITYFLFTDLTKFLPWIYQVINDSEDTSGNSAKYMTIRDDVTDPVTCRSADFILYEDEQERNLKMLQAVQQTADLSQQMTSRLLKVKERYQDKTTTVDLIIRMLKNNVKHKTLTFPRETIDKFVSVLPRSVRYKVKRVVGDVGREDALVRDEVSSVEIAELYLKTGARLSAQSLWEISPLLITARRGRLSVVKWLINEHHVDVKYRDSDGQNVLHLAARSGNVDLVRWLLNNTDVDVKARDVSGRTPLYYATRHVPALQYLVGQAKADVTVTDAKGCTVLSWAASWGSLQSVKWLVEEHHLDVNARDDDGDSVLYYGSSNLNIVKYLVQSGADVNITNNKQQTVLHMAAGDWERTDTVYWLLGNTDINVNSQDVDGNTALHLATHILAAVKYLVESGKADILLKNNKGQNVLDKARTDLQIPDNHWRSAYIQAVIDYLTESKNLG